MKAHKTTDSANMQSTMSGEKTIVFFDLETTGLDTAVCDIIQLSAISGDRVFNVYTLPHDTICDEATRVTGFTVDSGTLLLHGRRVETIPLREALSTFISFLHSFRCPLLLAAHNAKRFDAPVLSRALRECSLTREFREVESKFLDTFLISKRLFAHELSRFSQEYLVRHFLKKSYNAHNAVEDCRSLQELYRKWNPAIWDVATCTFLLPHL
ncbi:uncharacterized protein LOC115360625 [Myripristis murdjan]|uniref:exodeoxyribonuclease III n=1 Tax=Myripristis murdjan TaxID=586833 RepID=A0A667ZHK9_9TELE|nr:uncharacterized protein LOC115360625 [Myripristis murdjan]